MMSLKPQAYITREQCINILKERKIGDFDSFKNENIPDSDKPDMLFDVPEINDICEKMENEFKVSHGKPEANLKELLSYMEQIIDVLKPHCPCKKGCSYCCSMPVLMTSLEASIIEEYLIENKISGYKKLDIDDIIMKKISSISDRENSGKKCPFLKYGICDIYKARPLFGKRYISLDNDIKKCRVEDKIIAFTTIIIDNSYIDILKYYISTLQASEKNNAFQGDSRDFFEEY
jgi:hypothetical protein